MKSNDYIENILDEFDILEVIAEFSGDETVSIGTDTYELSSKECPFCGHKDAFRIKHQGTDSYFNCFSCDTGGDLVNFVAKKENLRNMEAAHLIETRCSRHGRTSTQVAPQSAERSGILNPTEQQLQIKEAACNYYQAKLQNDPTALAFQMTTRGHSEQTLEQWRIGLSDGRLVRHLQKQGFTLDALQEVGLANDKGYDLIPAGSFVYPHMNGSGRVGHFTQKDPKKEKRWQPQKSSVFFGMQFYGENTLSKLDESKRVAIVEGENDLLSMQDAAWEHPILATNGSISKGQIQWLVERDFKLVTFFDSDEAGDNYRRKLDEIEGITVTQYVIPDKDIDEYLRKGGCLKELMQPVNEWSKDEDGESQPVLPDMSSLTATDKTNAEILSRYIRRRARFVTETKEWAWYDDCGLWTKDSHHVIKAIATEHIGNLWRVVASRAKDDKEAGRIIRHAKYSESASGLKNLMSLLENHAFLRVSAADFDREWHLLGVQNGVFDLRSMTFRKSRPSDMITKRMSAEYKPDAACPTWLQFISKAFAHHEGDNHKAMIELLQVAIGMALVGRSERKRFFHVHGPQGSGKSVFLKILTSIFGSYAGSVSPNALMQPRYSDSDVKMPEVAQLVGVRLIGVPEAGDEFCFNDELLKRMTGGDILVVRELHKAPIRFYCMGTIFLNGNSIPSSSTHGSKAMMDRMTLIEFGRTIPPEERDTGLDEKLIEESPGILNWMIEGAQKYLEHGLILPDLVQSTCDHYVKSMDDIGLYIEDRYVIDPNGSVPTMEFYTGYNEWCKAQGGMPKSMKRVSPYMEQKGFLRCRKDNRHCFTGLRRVIAPFYDTTE